MPKTFTVHKLQKLNMPKKLEFTKKEQKVLKPFFTNHDKNVFVMQNMPQVLRGALFSRYSRSKLPLRRLFLDQYVGSDEIDSKNSIENNLKDIQNFEKAQNMLVTGKAKKFYKKWLAMYGDDSIAELGGIHIGIEDISMIATKSIEDRRIGISPLEKSTRYVRYDDKIKGKYRYYQNPKLKKSKNGDLYKKTMDFMFDTYSKLLDPMMEYFKQRYPKPEDVSEGAYKSSIRAKACDTVRGLLPMGTLTSMGIFANGRAIEYMLTKMYANPLKEVLELAESIHEESEKVIENFVERISSDKGEMYINYLRKLNTYENELNKTVLKSKVNNAGEASVTLIDSEFNAVNKAVASILYPVSSGLDYESVLAKARDLGLKEKTEIIENYVNLRQGRWHKVGKAFEEIYYTFDVVSDVGAYKDLQRHRMLSMFRQKFTTEHGYLVPFEIKDAGYELEYKKAMDMADNAYQKFKKEFPYEAQYFVGHGHLCRYRMKMNLREAFHFCELRSSPQGHPNYRVVAQQVYKLIKETDPILGSAIKFVNMEDPGLERLSAEVRKQEKLDAIKREK